MINNLGKSFIVYTASNLLSSALPYILLPFLTFALTNEDYGILSNFTGLIPLIVPLIGINFSSAYSRQYFNDKIDIKSYVGNGFLINLFFTSLLTLLFFLFDDFIHIKTGVHSFYIRLLAFYCFSNCISDILLTKWRLEDKFWAFGGIRVIKTIIEVFLTLILILKFKMDYEGRIIGIFLSSFTFLIPVVLILYRNGYLTFSINKKYIKHILTYGLPLIPHALGASILVYSDKLIISNTISLASNGIYSVGFQVALIIGLIQNSFNQAWVPWFYKKLTLNSLSEKKKIVRYTYLYFFSLIIATIIIILLNPIIFMIIDNEFKDAKDLVVWISIGFLFNGMYKMMVNYLFFMEKTILIGSITIVTAILNIFLNFYLINFFGITGAAIATTITFFIQFILVSIFSRKVMPMPWFETKVI